MIALPPQVRVFFYRRPTDMRKSFHGLVALTESQLKQDPLSGSLFVFVNRRQNQMKILYFDRSGYAIWSKRLEQGQFAGFSGDGTVKRALCHTEFLALLEGVDLVVKKRRKRYKLVA